MGLFTTTYCTERLLLLDQQQEPVLLDSDGERSWFTERGKRVYAQDRVWEHTVGLLPTDTDVWPWDKNPFNLDYCNMRLRLPGMAAARPEASIRFQYITWINSSEAWRVHLPDDQLKQFKSLRDALSYRDYRAFMLGLRLVNRHHTTTRSWYLDNRDPNPETKWAQWFKDYHANK